MRRVKKKHLPCLLVLVQDQQIRCVRKNNQLIRSSLWPGRPLALGNSVSAYRITR